MYYILHKDATDNDILRLLDICLRRNDFEFDYQYFLQRFGVPMGRKIAPSYANIYLAEFETDFCPICSLLPLDYKRFLDDIFLLWLYSLCDWDVFLAKLNNHHHSIKFVYW